MKRSELPESGEAEDFCNPRKIINLIPQVQSIQLRTSLFMNNSCFLSSKQHLIPALILSLLDVSSVFGYFALTFGLILFTVVHSSSATFLTLLYLTKGFYCLVFLTMLALFMEATLEVKKASGKC